MPSVKCPACHEEIILGDAHSCKPKTAGIGAGEASVRYQLQKMSARLAILAGEANTLARLINHLPSIERTSDIGLQAEKVRQLCKRVLK